MQGGASPLEPSEAAPSPHRSFPCRSCRADVDELVLDLGPQPASDHFPPADDPADDPRWPLQLWLCPACRLAQLAPTAGPLPEPPLAVESATSRAHAAAAAAGLLRASELGPGSTVLEAASHHGGSWLPHLLEAGLRVAEPADLVVDVHALAHDDDMDGALAAHARRLAPGGRLVLEFHHLLPLVEQAQFDTVRHGHPLYLSLTALRAGLSRHGLVVTDAQRSPAYGGSLLVTARPRAASPPVSPGVGALLAEERRAGITDAAGLRGLEAGAGRSAEAVRAFLQQERDAGRLVLGYGAPSKAPVLLCRSGVDRALLPFTVDRAEGKHGRRLPGCGVPIRPVADLLAARPTSVLVLTWDIAEEVVAQLPEVRAWGGRFLVPVPRLREVPPTGRTPDGAALPSPPS